MTPQSDIIRRMPVPLQPIHLTPARSHRFHFLDGLRGLAAVLVCVYHFPLRLRPLLLEPNGFLAVDFFFCLSGFVIAYAYEKRLREGLRMRDFVVARLIRLYPLYFLGMLIGFSSSLAVPPAGFNIVSPADVFVILVSSLLLLPNFMAHWPVALSFPFNVPSWSLFFELVANFAFAALLRMRRASSLAQGAVCAVSGCALLYVSTLGLPTFDLGAFPENFCWGFARVGFSFFAGVLILHAYQSARETRWRSSGWIAAGVALVLFAVLTASSTAARSIPFQLAAILLVFPAIVYVGACTAVPHRLHTMCAVLGNLSYPLYVLHFPLIRVVDGRKMRSFEVHHPQAGHLVVPLTIVFLAIIVWYAEELYDLPVRRWLTASYDRRVQGPEATGQEGR